MKLQDLFAKSINKILTKEKFIDKDINEYIYASLTQPPIKIIDENGSNDELDYTVECPNCKHWVNYGNDIYMIAGHIYCSTKGCREKLIKKHRYLKKYK